AAGLVAVDPGHRRLEQDEPRPGQAGDRDGVRARLRGEEPVAAAVEHPAYEIEARGVVGDEQDVPRSVRGTELRLQGPVSAPVRTCRAGAPGSINSAGPALAPIRWRKARQPFPGHGRLSTGRSREETMRAFRRAEVRPTWRAAALLAVGLAVPAAAALRPVMATPDSVSVCEDEGGGDRLRRHCEGREITLPAGRRGVEAAPNGGGPGPGGRSPRGGPRP